MSAEKKNNKKEQPQIPGKGPKISVWIYLGILLILLSIHSVLSIPDTTQRIEYSKFMNEVRNGNVEEVTVVNGINIRGKYKKEAVESGRVVVPTPEESPWRPQSGEQEYTFSTTRSEEHTSELQSR